jgi:hypothetical protein
MPAAKYDLAMEQGATFTQTITWQDSNNAPIDLTGATASMQIRTATANSAPGTPLVDLEVGSGLTLGGTAGTITITVTPTQTMSLTVPRAMYDLYVTLPGGQKWRLLEGAVAIDPTVTV